MITGSHNPATENGLKLIHRGGIPFSAEELKLLQEFVQKRLNNFDALDTELPEICPNAHGLRQKYLDHLLNLTFVQPKRSLRICADVGSGCAGLVLKELIPRLPHEIILFDAEPDGSFPNGVPNPLLPEKRAKTIERVLATHADLGIAWDGDFDRCFIYDEEGNFVESAYLIGVLASEILRKLPGATILHDPRLYWYTQEMVQKAGGVASMAPTGHAYMKAWMRSKNAVYGGEASGHHYFRDFAFSDSGMLPWLFFIAFLGQTTKTVAEIFSAARNNYPCSGEKNLAVSDPSVVLRAISSKYAQDASHVDHIDGLNIEYPTWRCNIRASNTEALVRLNVETKGDKSLLLEKTQELLRLIEGA